MKLFLLLATLSFFVPVRAAAGEPVEQAPVRLHSVQADFLQEKHLQILVRPIISTGTFAFQAPQSLRWEYRKPIPSILLMHGGKVRKFVERDGQLVEDRRMQLDAMQVVLAEISNWLDGRFTDNKMFSVSFPDKQTILLTPKEQGLAAMISSIELKLADQVGLLEEVTIFEGPGSLTKLIFRNRILNQEIPVTLFTDR
ncbi:MAG: hypothetical protein A2521_12355 [Deltaproteobacteria bacterium RIFOXYD12_FULL_57_12]|nr:MAG: hypothetical protein A2521_12355 [Deltaproteobacteria bacterium RIFOXYD12_FULL_57_12]